jgi:hypothetical protein
MRVYTLVFSILAHAMAVAAVVIAPLFATTELPEPHLSSTLVVPRPVTIADPDVSKERTRARRALKLRRPSRRLRSSSLQAFLTLRRTCR